MIAKKTKQILAHRMRQHPTGAERALFNALNSIAPGRFKKQRLIGGYIADIWCKGGRAVIEIDGGHHRKIDTAAYDIERTRKLNTIGVRVLRISNGRVLSDPVAAAKLIFLNLQGRSTELLHDVAKATRKNDLRYRPLALL